MIRGEVPIYDYRCDHCGHVFSQVQSFSESPVENCPQCGKKPRRLFTVPAIVFKGSGWYKTDSRGADKSEAKSETKSDSTTAPKGDSKGETKSDTKSESKSEGKSETKSDKPAPKSEAAS
jgi:putative FmdB family regulatory protein